MIVVVVVVCSSVIGLSFKTAVNAAGSDGELQVVLRALEVNPGQARLGMRKHVRFWCLARKTVIM